MQFHSDLLEVKIIFSILLYPKKFIEIFYLQHEPIENGHKIRYFYTKKDIL
jgi:hypothetical protein